jgi:hypothetical protein
LQLDLVKTNVAGRVTLFPSVALFPRLTCESGGLHPGVDRPGDHKDTKEAFEPLGGPADVTGICEVRTSGRWQEAAGRWQERRVC